MDHVANRGGSDTAFERAVAAVRAGRTPESQAKALYDQLTEDERLNLLDGDTPFWEGMRSMGQEGYNVRPYVHGAVDRLGIPGTRFVDGPRGCVAGKGTAFPVSMARGATWDLGLEERVGEVIGREIRAQGGNFFGGVCINLPRHPAWGRIQETYGDDPHHLGAFGAALTRGAQKYVMACAKHYALNSISHVVRAPARVRSHGDEGRLRPLPRPAPARQARREGRVPARVRPVVHHVHDRRGGREGAGPGGRAGGRHRDEHGPPRWPPRRAGVRALPAGRLSR